MNMRPRHEPGNMPDKLPTAVFAATFLAALCLLPFASLTPYHLLLTVVAIQACSAFTFEVGSVGTRVYLVDSFLLLSLLLFGTKEALVFAPVIASCAYLRTGKSTSEIVSRSSASVVLLLFVASLLWLVQGSAALFVEEGGGRATAWALAVAVLAQSVASASVGALTKNKVQSAGSRGRVLLDEYLKPLGAYLAAGCVVALTFVVVSFAGLGATLMGGAFLAVLCLAYHTYRNNSFVGKSEDAQAKGASEAADGEARFRNAFDFAAIGMALVSSEGRWLQVNRALCDLLGYTDKELLANDFLTVIRPDDLNPAVETLKRLRRSHKRVEQCELRFRHKSGREVWGLWSASIAGEAYAGARPFIFQIQDITDRKRAEEQLQHEAFHDVLTGLPNRAMFMDHLGLAIARAERNAEQKFAVLYLDLDRFKIINDSLGHVIGDQLLVEVAERLGRCVRAGDTVARFGGDEFVLLVEDIKEESEAVEVAERVKSVLSAPFELSGREVFTTVSVGIASIWTSYHQADALVRDADAAMYRAKSLGKNRHEIYDSAMHAQVNDRLEMETLLRLAVERKEFSVYYQPIVGLDTFKLRGFEALVRWKHPEKGFISPSDFIPLAEETGLIVDIGDMVLVESCRQMERWQKIFPSEPPLFVSVNLSGKQFIQSDLIQRIERIIETTRIDPEGLKLEITESAVMEDVESATEMLRKLRALGVKLSIDDFGTGYSSLSYLHKFPIDTLKIDRSFVMRMSEDAENLEIVNTIVTLAQNLGMNVIAEGVETNEQLSALRKLGCEFGQGYFFSKPVDSDSAENLICETYDVDASLDLLVSTPAQSKIVSYVGH